MFGCIWKFRGKVGSQNSGFLAVLFFHFSKFCAKSYVKLFWIFLEKISPWVFMV